MISHIRSASVSASARRFTALCVVAASAVGVTSGVAQAAEQARPAPAAQAVAAKSSGELDRWIAEDDHLLRLRQCPQLTGRRQPVHPGHPDIHESDVGGQAASRVHGAAPVPYLLDHVQFVARLEHLGQSAPHDLAVVRHQHTHHHAVLPSISVTQGSDPKGPIRDETTPRPSSTAAMRLSQRQVTRIVAQTGSACPEDW